jgi:hypothetical protein
MTREHLPFLVALAAVLAVLGVVWAASRLLYPPLPAEPPAPRCSIEPPGGASHVRLRVEGGSYGQSNGVPLSGRVTVHVEWSRDGGATWEETR